MARTYGVGIVGAGAISLSHLAAYRVLAPRYRVVGIADVDELRLRQVGQKDFIPIAVCDHRALLERADVDLIDICTPPSTHLAIARDALQAGKHVICEKPLAPMLEQVDQLIALGRAHPGRLSSVFQRRYYPEVRRLMQQRDDGALGALVAGRFSRFAAGRFAAGSGWWGSWSVAGGGTVMTQFVHELDLMRLVFGPPRSVTAQMDTLHLDIESEDTFAAVVRFESGAIVGCVSATGVGKSAASFEVIGSGGVYQFSSASRGKKAGGVAQLKATIEKGRRVLTNKLRVYAGRQPVATGDGGSHRGYLEAILAALDLGQPLPIGPEDARGAVELATGIYASALSGETIHFPLQRGCPNYAGVSAGEYAAWRQGKTLRPAATGTGR